MDGYLGSPANNNRIGRNRNNNNQLNWNKINQWYYNRGYIKNDEGKYVLPTGSVPTAIPSENGCPICECYNGNCVTKSQFESILDSNNNIETEYLLCDPESLPPHCKRQAYQSCSQCVTQTTTSPQSRTQSQSQANSTTLTPQYQVSSSGTGPNTNRNFITINVPDNLLDNPAKMNEIITNISNYSATEGIEILDIYKHYQNKGTTTEAITTSQAPQTSSFESNNASNNQTPKQKVIGLVNNLSVEELKELMILMMDMDLDQTKSSNVFSIINAVKQQLMNNYSSQQEVENQLANHQIKSVSQLKNKLKEIDPETYEALFGANKTHKYNTSYIPGFQYTPPELWPLHQFKSPVCLKDKNQVSDPAFVFDKGTPVNALDYEGLQQLPEFLYYESQTQDEAEAMKAKKQIDHLCQTKCSQNCDFPICKALNCSNCNY